MPANVGADAAAVNRPILEVADLCKSYRTGGRELSVLRGVSLAIPQGETCAIIGPSGSGKTTLLGLCAGLDEATSGSVRIDGTALETLDHDERAALRNRLVGFVFQNFQLIPTLTAIENVLVPLELRGETGRQAEAAEMDDGHILKLPEMETGAKPKHRPKRSKRDDDFEHGGFAGSEGDQARGEGEERDKVGEASVVNQEFASIHEDGARLFSFVPHLRSAGIDNDKEARRHRDEDGGNEANELKSGSHLLHG